MEWAISLPGADNLSQLTKGIADIAGAQDLSGYLPGKFDLLYFGQEFCERLIPTSKQILKAFGKARGLGMKFVLVTPYVTEKGLEKLYPLLDSYSALEPQGEVVVNDWGVLQLLAERYPSLTPVLGRLLNKSWRDPRIADFVQQDKLKAFQTSCLSSPYLQSILVKDRVGRVELDYPPQGFDPELSGLGFHLSLYLPYGLITTGRICLLGSWGLKQLDKFKAAAKTCSRMCRNYSLELKDMSGIIRENEEWSLVQKGNSVFYRQKAKRVEDGLLKAKELGFDRIIFQPEPI